MRIFLGLRHAQLGAPGRRNFLAQQVGHGLGREQRGHERRERVAVMGHAHGGAELDAPVQGKAVEAGIDHRRQDFPHPVGAEVEAQQRVAVLHAGIVADGGGDDEFVGDLLAVGLIDDRGGVGEARSLAFRHRQVGLLHPVPALVAVHGVVAAIDGGDLHRSGQGGRQAAQILAGRLRRGVAAVGEGMDNGLHPGLVQDMGQRDGMVLMRVHATGGNQAEQVAGAAGGLQPPDQIRQHRVFRQAAVLDREADPRQVLHHHAPGADIEVADLGIAHLPIRQADIQPGGAQQRVRTGRPEPVEIRGLGQTDGIVRRVFAPAPAVQDHQHHGTDFLRVGHGPAPERSRGSSRVL